MTELYSKEYISGLKQGLKLKIAAFCVFTVAILGVYIISLTVFKKEWASMLIAVLGVLKLSVIYILLLCPNIAQLKAHKEASLGLKNKEQMSFLRYEGEQLKHGVYYVTMKVKATDEDGIVQERDILVEKERKPEFTQGESFTGVTFRRILQGYEKLSESEE